MGSILQIKGTELAPSAVNMLATNAKINASIQNVVIEKASGTVQMQGNLSQGKINIHFSPYFKWGFGNKTIADTDKDQFEKELKDCGLNDAQVAQIVQLIDNEANNVEGKITSPLQNITNGNQSELSEKSVMDDDTGFPLPDVPLNVNMEVAVTGLTINSVALTADTALVIDSIQTDQTTLNDFRVASEKTIPCQSMDVNELSVPGMSVQQFSLPELSTSLKIDQMSCPEMPLNLSTGSGNMDIDLKKVVDWHPRYRIEIGFKFLWHWIGIWVEFGLDLSVDVFYKLLISLLSIPIKLSNMAIKGLSLGMKIVNTVIAEINIGATKVKQIIVSQQ